jgi:hypothetical protein
VIAHLSTSNIALYLLWAVIIIEIIGIVIYSYLGVQKWETTNTVIVPTTGKCTPAFNSLPDITNLQCCEINGQITSNRYDAAINMVVANSATPYLTACEGFCTNGLNSSTQQCQDGVGQADFETCVQRLQPRACIGIAMPIAHVGLTYYYGYQAGAAACPTQVACPAP